MLCEERGLFLEIADVIRGLGLTILIGVIETRNEKIWARFAVEVHICSILLATLIPFQSAANCCQLNVLTITMQRVLFDEKLIIFHLVR